MNQSRKTKSSAKKSRSVRSVSTAKVRKKTSVKKKSASVKKTVTKKKPVKKTSTSSKVASKITRAIPKKKRTEKQKTILPKKTKISPKKETLQQKPNPFDELYQMLGKRRQMILQKLDTDLNSPEETGDKGGDMADIAQDISENELSFHLAEVESRELDKINLAIKKLNEGTYGICESCGERIAVARLKALPFANKCIQCQEQDEQEGKYTVAAVISYWEK
jgi:RNA polymerase-binding protein DksA